MVPPLSSVTPAKPTAPTSSTLLAQMQAANDIVAQLMGVSIQPQPPIPIHSPRVRLDPMPEAQPIAETLVQALVRRLGAASAQVWLYDPTDHAFQSVAHMGVQSPAHDQLQRLYADDTPIGRVVREGKPLLSNNLAAEPWIPAPEWIVSVGLRGFAAYPINLGQEPLGALSIFSYQPLDPEFLEVLKFICSYTASALVNARQTAQLQRQTQRDALIRQISQQLRQSLDLATMHQTLVDQVGHALQVDRCDFLHWLRPKRTDEILASYGSPELHSISSDAHGDPYQSILNHPEIEQRLQAYEPVMISSDFPLVRDPELVLPSGYRAYLIVPVVLQQHYQQEELGLLTLASRQTDHFSQAEIDLVQAVTTQAALAFNNAQLYEQTRQQAERAALMNRITSTVHQSLRWDQIVAMAMQALQRTLNLNRCCFYTLTPDGQAVITTHEARSPELFPCEGPYDLKDFGPFRQKIESGLIVQMEDLSQEDVLPVGAKVTLTALQIQSGVVIPVKPDRSRFVSEFGRESDRVETEDRMVERLRVPIEVDDPTADDPTANDPTADDQKIHPTTLKEADLDQTSQLGIAPENRSEVHASRLSKPVESQAQSSIQAHTNDLPLDSSDLVTSEPADVLGLAQGRLIGLVGAFKSHAYSWHPEEVELLQAVGHQLAVALTRAELFEQARQQAERLALLHSITAVIRSSLEPAKLFDAITQQIGVAFQADICILALWQPEDACLRPVGISAPQLSPAQLEELLPGLTLLLGEQPQEPIWSEQLLAARVPGIVPDSTRSKLKTGTELLATMRTPVVIGTDETVVDQDVPVHYLPILDPTPSGLLLVPLLEGEQLIGGISLKRIAPNELDAARSPGARWKPWTKADLDLAKAVAEQAAVAMGQARLLTQTQHLLIQTRQQADQASLINRMMDRIRYSLDLDQILQAAVEEIGLALNASRAHFVFADPQAEEVTIQYAYAQPGIDSWIHRQIPLRYCPLTANLETQTETIQIDVWYASEGADLAVQDLLQETGLESLMLARLHLGNTSYGGLSVHQCMSPSGSGSQSELRRWTEGDRKLLKLVAEQLVIAITQSRLYQKTQRQARRETLLNEITTQIRTSLDPKQVLQSIVRALARTIELDRCEISLYKLDLNPRAGSEPSWTPHPIVWSDGTFVKRPDHDWPDRPTDSTHPTQPRRIPVWSPRQDPLIRVEDASLPKWAQAGYSQVRNQSDTDEPLTRAMLSFYHCFAPGNPDSDSSDQNLSWLQPQILKVLQEGQPFVITDTQNLNDSLDAELQPFPAGSDRILMQTFFAENAVRSLALIPILQTGELIGMIAMIAYPYVREFEQDELSLAMAVAEQAGIALQQAQLYEQTRISAQRESLLRQIAQAFSSTYDPRQIIQIALEGMANALQVDQCDFISLSDPTPQTQPEGFPRPLDPTSDPVASALGIPTSSPQTPDQAESESANSKGLKIQQEYRRRSELSSRLGQIVSGDLSWLILLDCYGRHDSLLIDDVNTFPLPPQTRKNLLQDQVQAVLCVPVMPDATSVEGVLCTFVPPQEDPEASDRPSSPSSTASSRSNSAAFGNTDMELVQALADMTAVALQRAQLYERSRQQETTAAVLRGLTEGREAESRRLAADLHDQTLADLGALSRQIQHLAMEGLGGEDGRRQLQQMDDQLRETIAELRGIVEDLQPTAMRAFNLGPALRSLLERAAQRSPQPLVTRFDDRSDNLLSRLEPAAQSTVFRIVQEALNNVVKHAHASRIDVTITPINQDLEVDCSSFSTEQTIPPGMINPSLSDLTDPGYTHLMVKIIDNGVGMPQPSDEPEVRPTQNSGGHGLLNMRYRANLIGATVEWRGRRSGSGTVVKLLIPLPTLRSRSI